MKKTAWRKITVVCHLSLVKLVSTIVSQESKPTNFSLEISRPIKKLVLCRTNQPVILPCLSYSLTSLTCLDLSHIPDSTWSSFVLSNSQALWLSGSRVDSCSLALWHSGSLPSHLTSSLVVWHSGSLAVYPVTSPPLL